MRRARRLLLTLLLLVVALGPGLAGAQQKTLRARFIRSAIPADPGWRGWRLAPAIEVQLGPQVMAEPWQLTPSITRLTVKAVHNGTWVAFLLAWKDATRNAAMQTDTFRDAVALMVPVGRAASITMGAPKERVLILHWKADWQEDVDKGFQDVAQLYPHAWLDWYPFAPGEPPYDVRGWTNPEARRYLTGWVLGNPRSQPDKRTSVEEQVAEGYGTLTTNERQSAVGKGVYTNGEWRVVIARPFAAGDPNDPAWGPGKTVPVAFAAWDGGAGEIGGRKSLSDWVAVRLSPAGR
ncbi:MAG: nitrate reductase [Deltaproteobacteria bacterium]|nr:nitrate reductase [Deltaproteobacteria bacterium]MBI3077195.1 nitrate reductase [Deltaproteobacteria bacterium]